VSGNLTLLESGHPDDSHYLSNDYRVDIYGLRQFKPPLRIFVFYSWLSIRIAVVNRESFQKFLALYRDSERHKNLIDCCFGLASPLQKIHQNPFVTF